MTVDYRTLKAMDSKIVVQDINGEDWYLFEHVAPFDSPGEYIHDLLEKNRELTKQVEEGRARKRERLKIYGPHVWGKEDASNKSS